MRRIKWADGGKSSLIGVLLAFTLTFPPLAAQPVDAGAQAPFTVRLEPLSWAGLDPPPALHSYVFAQTSDGRWLFLGGLTNGMHGFQDIGQDPPPKSNFPQKTINDRIWVVDPVQEKVWSRTLRDLAPEMAVSLTVTNLQGAQVGDRLVVVGGYGYTSDGASMTTLPKLTVLDVDAVAHAVVTGGSPGQHIRQAASDEFLRVTGGELLELDGVFYLVFGQDFEGFYTPQSNGLYTYQVRTFELEDDGRQVKLKNKKSYGSQDADPQFRRRDLNVVPAIRPDGSSGITVYGGVFTPQTGPWHTPIYIDPAGAALSVTLDGTGFEQWMSQYDCPSLILWSAAQKSLHTVLFGGISEVYYHPGTGFNRDEGVPYINEISTIRRASDGTSRAYLLTKAGTPLRMPGLLGASAALILNPKTADLIQDGVVKLDEINQEMLVGHIYGGIQAQRGNHGPTTASNLILEVYLSPQSSAAIPVQVAR